MKKQILDVSYDTELDVLILTIQQENKKNIIKTIKNSKNNVENLTKQIKQATKEVI